MYAPHRLFRVAVRSTVAAPMLLAALSGTAKAQFSDLSTSVTASVPRIAPGGTINYVARFMSVSMPSSTTLRLQTTGDMTCTWQCTNGITSVPPPLYTQPYACPTPTSGTGNMTLPIGNMPRGTTLNYALTCVNSASAGDTVSLTAQAVVPEWQYDLTPSDNLSVVATPVAIWNDVAIAATDNVATAEPGGFVGHDIHVRNAGTVTATGVHVVDTFPAGETCSWTCTGDGCPASQGSGNIDHYADIPAYSSINYFADCDIAASATGTLSNSATVTLQPGVDDMQPADNTAVDTTSLAPMNAALSIGADTNYPLRPFTVGSAATNAVSWRLQNNNVAAPVVARITLDIPPRFVNARWSCDQPGQPNRCIVRIVENRWVVQLSMAYVFATNVGLITGLLDGPEETITLTPVVSVVNGTDPDPSNNTITTIVPVLLFRDGFEMF